MKRSVYAIFLLTFPFINLIYAQLDTSEQYEQKRSAIFSGSIYQDSILNQAFEYNQYHKGSNCTTRSVHRSIDGTCNNLNRKDATNWASVGSILRRVIPPVYNYNSDLVGENRKNPRAISELIFKATEPKRSPTLSPYVFTWGQFLDHDLTGTAISEETVPIEDILNDLIIGEIPFNRSLAKENTGVNGVPREQFNDLTSWIDASNVYGSTNTLANLLRTFTEGKLKTSRAINNEVILPLIDNNFTAGDDRALEQPGLTCLHILFVREHNRICDQLLNCGMRDDEAIFQKARKQVGALIQSITYNEFLPALGLQLSPYRGYDETVQPDIMNIFATAAFRLGHTMVMDSLAQFDDLGNKINAMSLAELFFNPSIILNNGIEGILNGLAQQFQEEIDANIVESLRSFLFSPNPPGPGFDLAALNIQRGRDHGLDHYNAYRIAFGLDAVENFNDITNDTFLQKQLAVAYDNDINNIDVWVGLLAEDHLPNASIGATLHAILSEQFTSLRDGDFYYYKNDPSLTIEEKSIIKHTRLSDVIKRNTNIKNIKSDVFYGPCGEYESNGLENCVPDIQNCDCETTEVCNQGICQPNEDVDACACSIILQIYNQGDCAVDLFFVLPIANIHIANIASGSTYSVYTKEGKEWILRSLGDENYNENYLITGCENQILNVFPCQKNCQENAYLSEHINSNNEVSVNNELIANHNINSTAKVVYTAGKRIRLKPGFYAKRGSKFNAFIDKCNDDEQKQPVEWSDTEIDDIINLIRLKVFPHPLEETATISYTLQQLESITITLYTATGQNVLNILEHIEQEPGHQQLQINVSKLPTGLYYLEFNSDHFQATKKLMITK